MQVVALKPGYYGGLRVAGELFDVDDGAKSSWFAPADVKQEEPKQEEPKQEETAAHKGKSSKKKEAAADDLV